MKIHEGIEKEKIGKEPIDQPKPPADDQMKERGREFKERRETRDKVDLRTYRKNQKEDGPTKGIRTRGHYWEQYDMAADHITKEEHDQKEKRSLDTPKRSGTN